MKIPLILIQLFVSSIVFSQGVLWNDSTSFIMTSLFPESSENTRSIFGSSYSLEKYCPYSAVNDQGNSMMCVAYALSTARSILYSKNKSLTDKFEISIGDTA